jgi:hypothetical protein
MQKEIMGRFFAVQILYPRSTATIKIDIRVVGGSRIVFEMGKS